ncbi:MAG: hypothetical protein ACI8PB_000604 [Desulforhopalus sp.]|jgi:hypothetical protein
MSTACDNNPSFKVCPMCDTKWQSMDVFFADPTLSFNGYQANFGLLDDGIFFFTHDTENCGSTMGIKVRTFVSLFSGEKYSGSKALSKDCPRYCLDQSNLERCDAQCENAFAREISHIIQDRIASCKDAKITI